jgi:hypothetical protein
MNKLIKVFLSTIVLAVSYCCLFACSNNTQESHSHVFTAETEAPTCFSEGVTTYTCPCGDFYVETIPKVSHNFSVAEEVKPTCLTDGYCYYYCEYECGSFQYVAYEGSATGHQFEKIEAKEPTCANMGNDEYYACVCGKVLNSSQEEIAEAPMIEKLPHTYSELNPAVPSTCVENGTVLHYTCLACKAYFDESKAELETIVAPLLEHSFTKYEKVENGHIGTCECGLVSDLLAHEYTTTNVCDFCAYEKAFEELVFVDVISVQDMSAELSKGNNVRLTKDIVGNIYYNTDKEVYIDLNGHNITGKGDAGVICVNKGVVHIIGKGVVTAIETNSYAIAVFVRGGKVVIDGGIYAQEITGTDEQYDMIYCKAGEIVVNGGTFKCDTPKWTLNCYDSSYANGTAVIIVNGGDFYGYDPAVVETETTSPVSFVAEGKTVEKHEDWYSVK